MRSQIRFKIMFQKVLLTIGICGGESGRKGALNWNPRVLASGTSGSLSSGCNPEQKKLISHRRRTDAAASTSIRLPQAFMEAVEYHVGKKQALIALGVKFVTAIT